MICQDLVQANFDCQLKAELLIQRIDELLLENRKQFEKTVGILGYPITAPVPKSSGLSDFAMPYFKYRQDDEWCRPPDNNDAIRLEQIGFKSMSFLNGHRQFSRVEDKKLKLAVMKEAISIKQEELHNSVGIFDAGQRRDIRLQMERYADLKKHINREDAKDDGNDSDCDESDCGDQLSDEADADADCRSVQLASRNGKISNVDKLLVSDPIFANDRIISAIKWSTLSERSITRVSALLFSFTKNKS